MALDGPAMDINSASAKIGDPFCGHKGEVRQCPPPFTTRQMKEAVNSVEDVRAGRCWDKTRIKRGASLGNMIAQDLEIRREI